MNSIDDIRYAELRFTLRMTEDSVLPRYKASAIRGGMGDMLLQEFCIREKLIEGKGDRCPECDFYDECLVQRIMYPEMRIVPDFMSARESVGYIVECSDQREEFSEGDELNFTLLLFGKNIFYLSLYLNAVYRLGFAGIGKYRAGYEVSEIKNVFGKAILENGNIVKERYIIRKLSDYVNWRLAGLKTGDDIPDKLCLKTITALSLKKNGEMLGELNMDAILDSALRRIYIMNCFDGIESDNTTRASELTSGLKVIDNRSKKAGVARYSEHKETKIILNGIAGKLSFDVSECEAKEIIIKTLLRGELLHVGSNTTFGFGKYLLEAL